MNTAILRGILVVIIAISLYVLYAQIPISLATVGIAIICFSIIIFLILFDYFFPKTPKE